MRRPSHFMLVFLIVVGTTLMLWGEKISPDKVLSKTPPGDDGHKALLVDRGRGDFVADPASSSSSSAPKQKAADAVHGPWTLFGYVQREGDEAAKIALGIGLELVPVGTGPHAGQALQSTVTGTNGAYSWAGLFPGSYRLRALPNDAAHLALAVDLELPGTAADLADSEARFRQDLVLPRPRKMHGRLASGNAPRGGLTVSVSETGLHRGTAVANADGVFEIAGVGKGPFDFQVRTKEGQSIPVTDVRTEDIGDTEAKVAVMLPQ